MIRLIYNDDVAYHIDMPTVLLTYSSPKRFYLRKDAFQASSRFDVEHGVKAQDYCGIPEVSGRASEG